MGYPDGLMEVLDKLKPVVKEVVGELPDFDNIWANVSVDFMDWVNKLKGTSFLNVKIYFIQLLVRAFDNDSIRTNKAIVDIVVAGTLVGGDEFKTRNWRGILVSRPIINRYLTSRGVMLVLKNKIGALFKYEYID